MDPLLNALPPEENPAGGQPPVNPVVPATPAAPVVSTETQAILKTLGEITETVGTIKEEWDDFKNQPPAAPATPPAEDPNKGKFTPKSWDDFPTLAEQKATEVVERTIKEANEATAKAKADADAADANINKEIDSQVAALEAANKLPPVGNAQDPNDPGRRARAELYGLAAKMGTMNLEMVNDTMTQLHSQGIHYDFKASQWIRSNPKPAGQFAPVGSSSNAGGAVQSEGPSYETIHKARSLGELARRAGM